MNGDANFFSNFEIDLDQFKSILIRNWFQKIDSYPIGRFLGFSPLVQPSLFHSTIKFLYFWPLNFVTNRDQKLEFLTEVD